MGDVGDRAGSEDRRQVELGVPGSEPDGADEDDPGARWCDEVVDQRRQLDAGGEREGADEMELGCVLRGDLGGDECGSATLGVAREHDVAKRSDVGELSDSTDAVEHGVAFGGGDGGGGHAGCSESFVVGRDEHGAAFDLLASVWREVLADVMRWRALVAESDGAVRPTRTRARPLAGIAAVGHDRETRYRDVAAVAAAGVVEHSPHRRGWVQLQSADLLRPDEGSRRRRVERVRW